MFMIFNFLKVITTTLVMIFKRETDHNEENSENKSIESQLSIFGTYKLMWKLLKLAPVRELFVVWNKSYYGQSSFYHK